MLDTLKYPKLRTYITFKDNFSIEPYVSVNMNRKYRSVLAQLRSGILPLEIECVRWKSLEVKERKLEGSYGISLKRGNMFCLLKHVKLLVSLLLKYLNI